MFVLSEVTCDSSAILELIFYVKTFLKIICVAVPIILVVSIMISIVKTLTSSKPDLSKLWKSIVTKIVISILVFYIPNIVDFVMNMVDGIQLDKSSCWTEATRENINKKKAQEDAERRNGGKKLQQDQAGSGIIESQNFEIKNDDIVLGHYSSKVNTDTLVLKDKKGKTLDNKDFKFESSNPAIAKVSSSGKITAKFGGITTIRVMPKQNRNEYKEATVTVIQSIYAKVKTSRSITAENLKTGKKETIRAGTSGILNGGCGNNSSWCNCWNYSYMRGDILKVGGKYYEISNEDVEVKGYSIASKYSNSVAEKFVNSHKFSSDTKYLFWTSHGSQVEYMFKGSKGNWKVYKTFNINTGDVFRLNISEKSACVATGVHIMGSCYVVGELNTTSWSYHAICKAHVGGSGCSNPFHKFGDDSHVPKSHGCTRFHLKEMEWLESVHSKIKGSRIVDF